MRYFNNSTKGQGAESAVRDMFFLVHGFSRKGNMIAVLYGFFDGSSTHDRAKVWTLCGFLGTLEAFESLDEKWKAVLDKKCWRNRPKEFHTYDCVHGHEEFTGWPFAERLGLFGDLATVLIETDVLGLGSVVIADDLPKLDTDDLDLLKSQGLGTPLDLTLQYILQNSINWTRTHSERTGIAPPEIGVFFDEEPPQIAERYHAFCDLYRTKHGFGNVLQGIAFGNSQKFTPLQAADMLAFCTYRFEMKRRFPEECSEDFPVIPGFTRLIHGIANEGGGYDLESLKKLVAIVRADPRRLR